MFIWLPVKVSAPAPIFVINPVVTAFVAAKLTVVPGCVTSNVATTAAGRVKLRSDEAELPVYCSVVPAAKFKFAAALLDCPRLLGKPPLATDPMLKTPELIVVGPL